MHALMLCTQTNKAGNPLNGGLRNLAQDILILHNNHHINFSILWLPLRSQHAMNTEILNQHEINRNVVTGSGNGSCVR